MRIFTLVIVAAALMSLSACKKDDPASAVDQYTNKLTVGSGMNASNFTLIGEGSALARTGPVTTVYYRLESAADFAGAGITIKVEKQTGSTYTAVASYPYSNPQAYGHIIMSAFAVVETGTYRATGMITATSAVVATTEFIVQ